MVVDILLVVLEDQVVVELLEKHPLTHPLVVVQVLMELQEQ